MKSEGIRLPTFLFPSVLPNFVCLTFGNKKVICLHKSLFAKSG